MDEEFSFSKDTVVTTEEDVIYFTSFFHINSIKESNNFMIRRNLIVKNININTL